MTLWFIVRHFDLCNVTLGRVCEKLRIYVLGLCRLIQKINIADTILPLCMVPIYEIWVKMPCLLSYVMRTLRDDILLQRKFRHHSLSHCGLWRINNLAHHYFELLLLVTCSPAQTLPKPIMISWCRHQMEFKRSQNLPFCIIPQPHQQATGLLTFSPIHMYIDGHAYLHMYTHANMHTSTYAYLQFFFLLGLPII